jgi:hypothetical protein
MTRRLLAPILTAVAVAVAIATFAAPGAASAFVPCDNWSNANSKGYAYGTACYDTDSTATTVHGWVVDDRADGYCVYSRAYYSGGSHRDSAYACPKGTVKEFTFITYGAGGGWSHQTIESFAA